MMKSPNRSTSDCLRALLLTAVAVAAPLTASAQYVCQAGYPYEAAETDLAHLVNVSQHCTHDFGITGYEDGNGDCLYEWWARDSGSRWSAASSRRMAGRSVARVFTEEEPRQAQANAEREPSPVARTLTADEHARDACSHQQRHADAGLPCARGIEAPPTPGA